MTHLHNRLRRQTPPDSSSERRSFSWFVGDELSSPRHGGVKLILWRLPKISCRVALIKFWIYNEQSVLGKSKTRKVVDTNEISAVALGRVVKG